MYLKIKMERSACFNVIPFSRSQVHSSYSTHPRESFGDIRACYRNQQTVQISGRRYRLFGMIVSAQDLPLIINQSHKDFQNATLIGNSCVNDRRVPIILLPPRTPVRLTASELNRRLPNFLHKEQFQLGKGTSMVDPIDVDLLGKKSSLVFEPKALEVKTLHSNSRKVAPSKCSPNDRSKTGQNFVPRFFPEHLMDLLSKPELQDILHWHPEGKEFEIIDSKRFEDEVLAKYFLQTVKYTSFIRKMNRWGFRQCIRGQKKGSFFHQHFCRDKPLLCLSMSCVRSHIHKEDLSLQKAVKKDTMSETSLERQTLSNAETPISKTSEISSSDKPFKETFDRFQMLCAVAGEAM